MKLIDAKKLAAEIDDEMVELDLHLSSPDDFEYQVDQFLCECMEDRLPRAKIITGIGTGMLNTKVKAFLNNHELVVGMVEKPGSLIVIF